MHGLEPSKEFGCAPFFEAGAIGHMLRPFEEKNSLPLACLARHGFCPTTGRTEGRSKKRLALSLTTAFGWNHRDV